MAPSGRTSRSHSLAYKLLKYIAGIYTALTIILTVFQFYFEYRHVSTELNDQLLGYQASFEPSLGSALWNIDDDALRQSLRGMESVDAIVGVEVLALSSPISWQGSYNQQLMDRMAKESYAYRYFQGAVKTSDFGVAMYDEQGELDATWDAGRITDRLGELRQTSFPIRYGDSDGGTYLVGYAKLYTGSSIVYQRVEYGYFLIFINALIKTILLWLIFLFFIDRLVSQPLQRLDLATSTLNPRSPEFDLEQQTLANSPLLERRDELGTVATSMESMRVALLERSQQVARNAEELERQVELRTEELRQKTDEISSMLANLSQGIFTIDVEGSIGAAYSGQLEEILDADHLAHVSMFDVLFGRTDISVDAQAQLRMAVMSIVQSEQHCFELNQEHLVRHCQLTTDLGSKQLEIDWQPMVDPAGCVEKLLVVVTDQTELNDLRMTRDRQETKLAVMGRLFQHGIGHFRIVVDNTQELISAVEEVMTAAWERPLLTTELQAVSRHVHTIKGNLRALKAGELAVIAHSMEEALKTEQLDHAGTRRSAFLGSLKTLRSEVSQLHDLVTHALEGDQRHDLLTADLLLWLQGVAAAVRNDQDLLTLGRKSKTALALMATIPLPQLVELSTSGFEDYLAAEGKAMPKLNVHDNGLRLASDAVDHVQNILLHCFGNSLVHGLESREDRLLAGKSQEGRVTVSLERTHQQTTLTVKDDGRGLNIRRLEAMYLNRRDGSRASQEPMPSDHTLAQMIFAMGVTTQRTVTLLGGRGVGMDAVRAFAQELGGDVVAEVGPRPEPFLGFVPLSLVITLPANCTVDPYQEFQRLKQAPVAA